MLPKMLNSKSKAKSYEVLFLRNSGDEDVEVHEVKHVDFLTIKERLERGESVFITSKCSQKVAPAKPKSRTRPLKTRLVTAFQFERV